VRIAGALFVLLASVFAQEAPGPEVACPRAQGSIRVDGNLTEEAWSQGVETLLSEARQIHPNYLAEWRGPRDLSARVRALIVGADLYLGIEVQDDVVIHEPERPWWVGDSIEIFLDTDLQSPDDPETYSDDDHQIFLLPFHPGLRWGVVSRGPGAPYPDGGLRGIEVASTARESGYTVEARIPLSNLEPIRPDAAGRIGFDLAINDVDGAGRASTETYMTLSGRQNLFQIPGNFARLKVGTPPFAPPPPERLRTSPPLSDLLLLIGGAASVALVAFLLRRAVRGGGTSEPRRLRFLMVAFAAAACSVAAIPLLAPWLDTRLAAARHAASLQAIGRMARAYVALDDRPAAQKPDRMVALLRDRQTRIQPGYRYHFIPVSARSTKGPSTPLGPGPVLYRIDLAPSETRSFPLEGIAAPQRVRVDVSVPDAGDRAAGESRAAVVRFDFEEGAPLVETLPRRVEGPVLLSLGSKAGMPLKTITIRNELNFQPIVLDAIYGERETGGFRPLPLAARTYAGVPLDVWHGTPASHLVPLTPSDRHVLAPVGIAGHRLWIALGAAGAYPQSRYGADAVQIAVTYRDGQPGPELLLRNGIDVQDHQLAYRHAGRDEGGIALEWENPLRLPVHYSLHEIELDPDRPVERIEVRNLKVLSTCTVAAATLGVRGAVAPPGDSGLVLRGNRVEIDEPTRAALRPFLYRLGRSGAAREADDHEIVLRVPIAAEGTEGADIEVRLPSSPWAALIARMRGIIFGVATLLAAFAAVLAGTRLLQRARQLRIKMLVALGAATILPLIVLVVGLTTILDRQAEEELREGTLAELRGVAERISGARARARALASRVRDTLDLVAPQGEEALSHQVRRVREEIAAQGAFLRLPEEVPTAPSPLGNTAYVDTITRAGLYYSPWDGLIALGLARGINQQRTLVGLRNEALLGAPPTADIELLLYGPDGEPLAATHGIPDALRGPAARGRVRAVGGEIDAETHAVYEARTSLRGQTAASAHAPIEEEGVLLGFVGVYRGRAATDAKKIGVLRTLLLSGLAGLLLVVVAGSTLVDRVTDRLQRLTRAARTIAGGDLTIRIPIEAEDEVGRLARSFNQMADALGARIGQVTELHAGLQELTAALDAKEVAHAAAGLLARASGATHVVLATFDPLTESLEIVHRLGEGAPLGHRLPETGPARRAAETRAPVFAEGAVFLPLVAAGRLVGLAVCSPVANAETIDRRFLDASGRQIGIAIENARLYRAAVTDERSGLYTHAFLMRRLREEVDRAAATGRPLSLLRIVLEDYPALLQRLGPASAGRLMAELATVAQGALSRRNMLASRETGELTALLVECDEGEAERLVVGVASAIDRHEFAALAGEARPAIRFRRVTYPQDGAGADILLEALLLAREIATAPPDESAPALLIPDALGILLGKSAPSRAALDVVARVAPTNATVLLTGETGVGKEVMADLIRANSRRRDRPFVKVNCAAIPESLVETELFGHEKGAFTGAERQRIGRFEESHTGTIFLDEIGELPLPMQAKLLRVLQERRITRVGGASPIAIDVRILAASNRDLRQAMQEGRFREDLFHRLQVIELRVPPLRERRDEIPLLLDHFRKRFNARHSLQVASFAPDALDALYRHTWPGNVRELRNVVERAMLLAGSDTVARTHLALPERAESAPAAGPVHPGGLTPRQERILARARQEGGVTNGDVVRYEEISARTALRELQALVDRGLLRRLGRRRGAIYRP